MIAAADFGMAECAAEAQDVLAAVTGFIDRWRCLITAYANCPERRALGDDTAPECEALDEATGYSDVDRRIGLMIAELIDATHAPGWDGPPADEWVREARIIE